MSDRTALIIAIIIVAAIITDFVFNSGDGLFFIAKKGEQFIEWVAFWR